MTKPDSLIKRLARRPMTWVVVALIVAAGGFGLYWFAPWRLFTSKTVNEPLPALAPAASATGGPTASTTTAPAGNVVLSAGTFVTLEHSTSGQARLIRLTDGRVQLVLQDLDTSDGPDLHVWLTDRQVITGTDGWRIYDDGRYVELGALKGNRGNQVYDVPAGTDLTGLRSVAIWCKRFAVGFGAAELAPA